ncbi:MAG: AraC family transcriptional regulator [Firmicutes bacterium]|nr:AraC family transcriptional regulator [Bacillota bacterium]
MVKKAYDKNFDFFKIEALSGVSLLEAEMYDFSYKTHTHKEFAIAVTRRGIQSFKCNKSFYKVSKNGIITFNPQDVHNGYSELESGLEYQMLYVSQETINKLAEEVCGNKFSYFDFANTVQYDYELSSKLLSLFRAINEERNNCEIQSKFYDSISTLMLKYGLFSKKPISIKEDNSLIKRACKYIDNNVNKAISLDDIAREVNLSPYYFSRLFKKTTGLSPHNYLNQRRVEMVKKKIKTNKDASLSEIAVTAGFSDQSHMNRRFKEIYGITPGKYKTAITK